jgi:hypothetical protein
MNPETITVRLTMRWWVRPLVVCAAVVWPFLGLKEESLSRFIARRGFRVER